MALWRSWLARRPVTAEVAGSSPVRVADCEEPVHTDGLFARDGLNDPSSLSFKYGVRSRRYLEFSIDRLQLGLDRTETDE